MSRCGCSPNVQTSNSLCACNIGVDDGLSITGDGTAGDPFVIAPVIDPDADNQLEVSASGLLVPRNYPLGILAYTSITAESTGATGSEVDILTLAAVTPIGPDRYWKLWFHAPAVEGDVAEDVIDIRLKEGATQLGFTSQAVDQVNIPEDGVSIQHLIIAPSEVAHTYKIAIIRSIGSGLVNVHAASNGPAWLVLEDAGRIP